MKIDLCGTGAVINDGCAEKIKELMILLSLYADEAALVYKKQGLTEDERRAREISDALYVEAMTIDVNKDKRKTEKESETEKRFARFWEVYPAKVKKKDAFAAWRKLDPSDGLTEEMIGSVKEHCATDTWAKGYVPYPATFIRGEMWNDDLSTVASPGRAGGRPKGRAAAADRSDRTVDKTWEIMKAAVDEE